MRSKVYQPLSGWGKLLAKVVIASAVLGVALVWLASNLPWLEWRAMPYGAWQRILSLFGIIAASSLAYFAMLALMGLNFKALLKTKAH